MSNKPLINRTQRSARLLLFLLGLLLPQLGSIAAILPPVITSQPVSQTVLIGQSVTFNVAVTSSTTPYYQWRKSGTNIAGATNSSYTIASAQLTNQATYSVLVTNLGGSVTSSNATLTVLVAPSITSQPHNQSVRSGQNASFVVVASGTAPLKYQWFANSNSIAGATNASYTITNVQAANTGFYSVSVSNAAGFVISGAAALSTNLPPAVVDDSYSLPANSTLVLEPPTANLANWWTFNAGGTNQTVLDSGSIGNHGTRGSTAGVDSGDPAWTTGYVGAAALAFDGSSDYVSTPSTVVKTSSAFTLSAWFKTSTTVGQHHILWAGYSGGNGYGDPTAPGPGTFEMNLSVGYYNQDNKIVFFFGYDVPANGADPISIISASDFTDTNRWHHALVTVSNLGGGTYRGSLYVDGVLEGSDTGVQNDRSQCGAMLIGKPGAAQRYFQGAIDEVRVYDSVLTDTQIQSLVHAGVLQNDADVDSRPMTVNTATLTGPTNGSLTMSSDGSFAYTPNPNFTGTDSFTYRASDGLGDSSPATVTLTVAPVNQAPVANPQNVSTSEATAKSITLTGSDADSNPLTFAIVTPPAFGAISSFNTNTGTLTYTPNAGYTGADIFTFRTHDGTTNSAPATVSITVTPVAPSITAQPQGQTVTAGQNVSLSVSATGSNPMGYQWHRNGTPLAGATSSTLTLNQVQTANGGDYSVAVTNAAGSVSSAVASLVVSNPPPVLAGSSPATLTAEGFSFGLSVPVGATYIIEASSNLRDWAPIATNVAASGTVVFTDTAAIGIPSRMYRAKLP